MCDDWMRPLKLAISIDEFHALPRNNAYKYEYFDGHAHLTPRPKYYHALLDLGAFTAAPPTGADPDIHLRPVGAGDWDALVPLFAAAFERQPPFGGLSSQERLQAAQEALERTRIGGDGPIIDSASLLALDGANGGPVGAVLITLLPDADPTEWGSFYWPEPPPADALARRLGRPHLTWVFVHSFYAGRGTGTALLIGAAGRLRDLGYRELASTFLPTNDSSVLWHWRSGFRLIEYAGSTRRLERRIRKTLQ